MHLAIKPAVKSSRQVIMRRQEEMGRKEEIYLAL